VLALRQIPVTGPLRITWLPRQLVAGATLGALTFVAARALGLPFALHLHQFELFIPSVILGAILFVTPIRRVAWVVAGTFAALIAIVAYTPIMNPLARAKVRVDPLQRADAVVVLASSVNDDSLIAEEAVDRLLTGIAIARDSRIVGNGPTVPLVLTTVTQQRGRRTSSIADQRRLVSLIDAGRPIRWTPPVYSTRDEAMETRKIATREGWRRVAVVTSPLHSKRACATFERAGLDVVCVPARTRQFAVRALAKPADRLYAFRYWFYETAGTVYYKLRRWIA
jgi:uncharacterized SAM-binding protein YcdF (DUF218 family)